MYLQCQPLKYTVLDKHGNNKTCVRQSFIVLKSSVDHQSDEKQLISVLYCPVWFHQLHWWGIGLILRMYHRFLEYPQQTVRVKTGVCQNTACCFHSCAHEMENYDFCVLWFSFDDIHNWMQWSNMNYSLQWFVAGLQEYIIRVCFFFDVDTALCLS